MKTNIIDKIEKLNEEKKLNKEGKEKIKKIFLLNLSISNLILIYFISLMIAVNILDKQLVKEIYQVFSFVALGMSFILFEISYKKSSESWFLYGLEILSLSVISLFVPYLYVKQIPTISIKCIGIFYTFYYIVKSIVMAYNEKKTYIKQKNDIREIIKKESQDEMSRQYFEKKLAKNKKSENSKTTKTGKKRGRPKKKV